MSIPADVAIHEFMELGTRTAPDHGDQREPDPGDFAAIDV